MSDMEETKEEECELCNGVGEVIVPEWDRDSGRHTPTGVQTCLCQIKEEDPDRLHDDI